MPAALAARAAVVKLNCSRSGGCSSRKDVRGLAARCSGPVMEDGPSAQPVERRPVVVRSVPAARAAAPPPHAVPVEHSSSFLLRSRRQSSAEAPARGEQRSDQEPFSGNAMEWVLRKADESLDEIEDNPPEYVKTIYEVSNGPIGKTASATVTTAAKATVLVGANALKAAAPLGKWALQQGFKLAVGAVSTGLSAGSKSKNSKGK